MKTNGVKKPTSSDVAALAGVSQASVSLILSGSTKVGFTNETKERVFAAAKQLGYQPPAHRKLKKRTSRLILVLIPTLTNQYYSELVQTLEQYSDSLGYRVLVCNTFRKQELEKYYLEQFTGSKISGIIYAFLPSFPREVERLSATTPLVLIGEKSAELPICSIELSNMRAGALLAEHLYRLGHRRVSFLSTPMNQMTLARRQRLEGLRQKLVECGQRDGEKVSVDGTTVSMPAGTQLDLGGIGKGYASAQAKKVLQDAGVTSAIVSLGGNISALGHKPDGSNWTVAIQDPADTSTYFGLLETADKCVITSGGYQRYFEQDGKTYWHILDPGTGYPADSGILSATVVSSDDVLSDGLSTALFVMGLDKAEALWRENSDLFDMILMTSDRKVYITSGISDDFTTELDCEVVRP